MSGDDEFYDNKNIRQPIPLPPQGYERPEMIVNILNIETSKQSEGDDKEKDKKDDKDGKEDGKDKKGEGKDGEKEDKNQKKSPLKNPLVRWGLIIAAIVLLIVFLIWLFHWWTYGRYQQSTNDAYLNVDQVQVAPQVPGYVTQVLVDDNQQVKAGQALITIDPNPYIARWQQMEAQINVSKADIVRYQAQIHQQEAQIAQAQAQLTGAHTNTEFYKGEVARYAPLSAAGAETSEKLAQLENSYNQAAAQEAADQAQVVAAQRQIETLNAQILQAQAQVQQAEAQARQAKIDLDYTVLHASMDGRVGDKTVRVGQYLEAGAKIMSLVPLQQIFVEANYKETQIGLMRVGQPVTVRVDALTNVKIRGVVASFSPGTGAEFSLLPPENATGNFTKIVQRVPVRIRLIVDDDTRAVLVPGLSVETSVNTISQKDFPKHAKREFKQEDLRAKQIQASPQPASTGTNK